jgi:hypothetical protein
MAQGFPDKALSISDFQKGSGVVRSTRLEGSVSHAPCARRAQAVSSPDAPVSRVPCARRNRALLGQVQEQVGGRVGLEP